jgi:hypothetical protein
MDIFRLLGPEPGPDDWETFDSAKVFSAGVTQGLRRFSKKVPQKDTNAYAKVGPEQKLTSSRDCLVMFGPRLMGGSYGSYLAEVHRNGGLKLEECNHSAIATQPKDASIDRVIATEPLLNAMAQQGICAMLIPYLRKWGIHLTKQEANALLALEASLRGFRIDGFSTVDLTSASDTVLGVLVKYLIPRGWYKLLDAARTQAIKIGGNDPVQTEMFSTMGNGFTFPLQCLIFGSLTRAAIRMSECADRRYRVYGDDIIVPTSATMLLLEGLKWCGFIPNWDKSYVVGWFRESCGADYASGHDVRPVYLKGSLGLRTERHLLFNRLQAKDPGHPVLDVILTSEKEPLIGPAIGPTGGESTHYCAPIFVLRERGMLRWNQAVHAYDVTYVCMIPYSRKRRRDDNVRRLLATLAGSAGERHDIRDTVRYRIGVRTTTTPFVTAPTSPIWYR